MGAERTSETPKLAERLRTAAKATHRVAVEALEAVIEFDRTHRVDSKKEEPRGWQDPDDDDIQFQHNGAPYNR